MFGAATGAVSGRTSFLVVGDQCSSRKYNTVNICSVSASILPADPSCIAAGRTGHPQAHRGILGLVMSTTHACAANCAVACMLLPCCVLSCFQALEKGCKVIDEDGFLTLAAASASLVQGQQQAAAAPIAVSSQPLPAAAVKVEANSQPAAAAAGAQRSSQQQAPPQQAAGGGAGRAGVPKMSSMAFHGTSGGAGPSRVAAAAAAGAAPTAASGANLGGR